MGVGLLIVFIVLVVVLLLFVGLFVIYNLLFSPLYFRKELSLRPEGEVT